MPDRATSLAALQRALVLGSLATLGAASGACGPGAGTDAVAGDARVDGPRDAATDTAADAPADGSPDASRTCPGPCAECTGCVNGMCVPIPDGRGCGGGVCRRGACCTGCWDGEACLEGTELAACGATGAVCRDCDCEGDSCGGGECVPRRPARMVAAGGATTCATDTTGALLCWGRGSRGAVGHGAFDAVVDTPTDVGRAAAVSVGGGHACAILEDGGVQCWGANDRGQLGLGDVGLDRNSPTTVPGLSDVTSLSLGDAFGCAVDAAGKLRCWGAGESGQLGISATDDLPTPTAVAGAGTWTSVGAGDRHVCALDPEGRLFCWGANEAGQLGLGVRGITRGRATPTLVDETTPFAEVFAGSFHSCAQGLSRTLFCWGANDHGQLGTGDRIERRRPSPVGGVLRAADGGSVHGCSIQSLGAVTCWGDGGDGRLGTGDDGDRLDPSIVGTRRNYVAVSAGKRHSCVVDDRGAIYCWGDGATGQLGAAGASGSDVPVRACLPAW